MLIDFETAVSIFEKIPLASRLPSFHPSYLVADAARECGATRPVFFLYQEAAHVFYFPFLLGPIPGTPFFDIQSPYGYGGPLLSSQDPEFLNRAYRAYRAWCAEQNVVAEFIRFHPLAENWQSYDGERLYNRETVWLDLAADSAYEQRVRTALKKAAKDLSIRFSDAAQSLDHFREIYWQGMQASLWSTTYRLVLKPAGNFQQPTCSSTRPLKSARPQVSSPCIWGVAQALSLKINCSSSKGAFHRSAAVFTSARKSSIPLSTIN